MATLWYMECMPCIKAISHLNEISKRYSEEDIAVVGLNPLNNNKKDLARMPNFLDYNPISYPFIFIPRELVKEFQVVAYPTFYLLGENREVLYSAIGYSEEMNDVLDSAIEANL